MPLGDPGGLSPETEVIPSGKTHEVAVGDGLLGRVLDGLGNFMDNRKAEFIPEAVYPANGRPPSPLSRQLVSRPLCLGVRAIDALLTCGEGQRMGIFAAAGVGKSALLAQLLRNTDADVVVLALIGERGREVREFLEMVLTEDTRDRTVAVVSTSDRPPLEWIKSAYVATTIAEYFRDQGKRILLLVDSLTRFARAQRLVGLTCGEPPARRGFPPSVFSVLPQLLERAGNAKVGSITALYTILVEGDDMNEPVADEVRSLLDGHIVLSRTLAAANHFPAISVLDSVSRVMTNIIGSKQASAAGRVRELIAKYEEAELLLKIGEYKEGVDSLTDEAIAKRDRISSFLQQKFEDFFSYQESIRQLEELAQR
jgi:type III secretion protein N (ATPase)